VNEETELNAAAVTFVVIPCLKDKDRLGTWVFLTPSHAVAAGWLVSVPCLPGICLLPQTIQLNKTSPVQKPEKLLAGARGSCASLLNLCHMPCSI